MTDRTVLVRVRADVAQYRSSIVAAGTATRDFANQSLSHAAKHEQAFNRVGKAAVAGGALVVGALTAAVVAAAKFDQEMSVVKANIDDKSAPSMAKLAAAALDAGRSTVFSATSMSGPGILPL